MSSEQIHEKLKSEMFKFADHGNIDVLTALGVAYDCLTEATKDRKTLTPEQIKEIVNNWSEKAANESQSNSGLLYRDEFVPFIMGAITEALERSVDTNKATAPAWTKELPKERGDYYWKDVHKMVDHNVIQEALEKLTVDQMNLFCNKLAFTVLPGRQIIASMLLSSVDQKFAALLEVIP